MWTGSILAIIHIYHFFGLLWYSTVPLRNTVQLQLK